MKICSLYIIIQYHVVECEEKTAAVLQQGRELQQANQQERYLLEQLQEKTKEVKGLEECLQAEKAAHLDCKFTAEIAQVCNLATVVMAIFHNISVTSQRVGMQNRS